MRTDGGGAARRKAAAPSPDGPTRRVGGIELDRRGTDDPAVPHVDMKRPAVGQVGIAHGAVLLPCAVLPPRGTHQMHELSEPDRAAIRAGRAGLEILQRIDDDGVVRIGIDHGERGLHAREHHFRVRPGMRARHAGDRAILEDIVPAKAAVSHAQLHHAVTRLKLVANRLVLLRRSPHHHRQCEQNGTKQQGFHAIFAAAGSTPRSARCPSSKATSSIKSSWPPTALRRPISTRMSRADTPYFCAARWANNRNEE